MKRKNGIPTKKNLISKLAFECYNTELIGYKNISCLFNVKVVISHYIFALSAN